MPSLTNIKQYLIVTILGLISLILFGFIVVKTIRYESNRPKGCNVAVIPLTGRLFTTFDPTDTDEQQVTSDQIDQELESAKNNPQIKAIVLSIDSQGGSGVAGEDIFSELKSITNKPTIALARSQDDSAAYLASLGANAIFASDTSGVVDIGVTSSYTDNSVQEKQQGITFNQLSIGKYKDMFHPDKPMTADERALAMSQAQEDYQMFVQLVATNRKMTFENAKRYAEGIEYLGIDALKYGLIDHLGNIINVQKYLSQKIDKEAALCKS